MADSGMALITAMNQHPLLLGGFTFEYSGEPWKGEFPRRTAHLVIWPSGCRTSHALSYLMLRLACLNPVPHLLVQWSAICCKTLP